jgi:hypothetical protein
MTTHAVWTQGELVRRVAAVLADPAYPGAPNGRVRDVPDRRAVRWYTTIGLVDRPAAMQGRTALYGPRHLLQIVAIKRLQAQGRSIAEIQTELVGVTDKTLRRIADIADEFLAVQPDRPGPSPEQVRPERFWASPPAAPRTPRADAGGADSVTMLAAVGLPGGAVLLLPAMSGGAGRPDDEDIRAIHTAAQPLLDLLADRGLLAFGKEKENNEWSPS